MDIEIIKNYGRIIAERERERKKGGQKVGGRERKERESSVLRH